MGKKKVLKKDIFLLIAYSGDIGVIADYYRIHFVYQLTDNEWNFPNTG